MSPRMQTKLLRFLNDGTFRRVGEDHEVHVDVRVICATQKNLVELVQKGLFREDLYYRLNVLTLNLPPLRDCPQDIMPLTELFVARFADEQGVPRPKLSADLSTVLTRYGWPGNVRQLKNAIYRALTQLEGYELRPQDILLPDYDAATVAVGEEVMEGSLDEITSRFERSVLTQLYMNYPSTRKLAKRLGVSHTAIANKLREYGLSQQKKAKSNAVMKMPPCGGIFVCKRSLRFQYVQRRCVVWFVGDFIDQLAEDDVVIFIDNNYGTCGQTFQRAFSDFNTVVFQEFCVAQGGQRDNVAQTFRAAKTRVGEWQVGRNTQYDGIVDFCRQLVKLTYRCRANASIDAWENIQHFALACKLAQRNVRQVFSHKGKSLSFASSLRNGAGNCNRVATEMNGL